MTVTIHPRERGATLRCNNCPAKLTTGQIQIKAIRSYAQSRGWLRGLLKRSTGSAETGGQRANAKHDICPACAPAERARDDARRQASNERRAKRDELRKLNPADRLRRKRDAKNKAARDRRAAKRQAKEVANVSPDRDAFGEVRAKVATETGMLVLAGVP